MGKLLPGIIVAFENPKGGVGKSTLTALFAGYIHSVSRETGLTVGVVDIDDAQNTLGKMRQYERQEKDLGEEYQVMNISSEDFIGQMDFLKDSFDIILIDFPGNLKQAGVIECLMMVDIMLIPFEPSKIEVMHTLQFFEYYKTRILSKRQEAGYKTTYVGLPNRVVPNVLEYKDLIANQDQLPFKLTTNHIKESRVNYQRNLSTLISDYTHTCDEFGEEVIQIITEHVKNM